MDEEFVGMRWKRAIVLGGSMAGLFAARVLSDHFEEVLVLERDALPPEPDFRNGVPQARHLHQILAAGQRVMESLFPELVADLEAVGAPRMEWGVDNVMFNDSGPMPAVPSGVITNTCSRITLEYLIRQRLLERDNVQILERHRTVGLVPGEDRRAIAGVQVSINRGREEKQLFGDLILDATGRRSKTPEWFTELGYEQPPTTYVNAHIGYATCWFRKPETPAYDFVMLGALASGDQTPPPGQGMRSGVITEIEGDRWVAILSSNNKDYPPTDHAGFLEFARTLRTPAIYAPLTDAEPISPVYGSRSTYSLWHHYEKLAQQPERYLVTGDAACGFNPIYGQGMSVAALDAELLGKLLRGWHGDDLAGFAAHFQRELAKSLQGPWTMATASDKSQPSAEGDIDAPSRMSKVMDGYFGWVMQTLEHDPAVLTAFIKVMNMLEPPESLAKPGVFFRVLRHKLTGYSNMPNPPEPSQDTQPVAAGD